MSNERDDGGPAFPCLPPLGPDGLAAAGYPYVAAGMTLRDYFAAKALQGLLADLPKTLYSLAWKRDVTICAYELADQMLKARKEPTT